MTFDKLVELIEENRFRNKNDRKIAIKIIEAERDWRISFDTLNEFIIELEKEADGIVTKSSLKKLLNKYKENISRNAWEMESVTYLIDIFELTNETELRKIIINLSAQENT